MSFTEKLQSPSGWVETAPRSWGVRVTTKTIRVNTQGHNDVQDLTEALNQVLADSHMSDGTATLFVQGSTAGVTTIEFEPGVVSDLDAMFERIAPKADHYQHEARWQAGNGFSHVRAALLGPSMVVPFTNRELTLGTWQQVVLVDFDSRPRQREIVVQLIGN